MEKYTLISLNRDIDMTNPYGFRFLTATNTTKATSADSIESGQWCFDDTERCYIFKPLIENNRTYGHVRFSTKETITGGDVIEVEYDVKNTGFNAKMLAGVTIDILNAADGWTHNYNFVTRDSTNGYITFKDRWTVPVDIIDDRHFAIVVGFTTSPANTGQQAEMRIRDIKINIIRNGGGIGLDDNVYTGLGIDDYVNDGIILYDDPEKPLEGARDITLKSGVYGYKTTSGKPIKGNGVLFVLPYRSKAVSAANLPYIIQLVIINDADSGAGVYRRGYSDTKGWSEWHQLYEYGKRNIQLGNARIGTSSTSDPANYGISLQDPERSTNYAYLETYHYGSQPGGYISGLYVYNQVARLPEMKFVPKEGSIAETKWIMPIHSCIDAPSAPKVGDTPLTAGYMVFNRGTNKPMWWGTDNKWHYADGTVAE